jgi:hypothetical protein
VTVPPDDHAVNQIFTSFRPSAHGFGFRNSWPDVPVTTVAVGGVRVPIGSAANGMCGGMVFAALDFFMSRRAIPSAARPAAGEPLYEFIAARLIDSFDLPTGPLKYLDYMNPGRRDRDNWFSWLTRLRGRDYLMLKREWPRLRARLDAGPCPVAWVHVRSADPFDLGENHVVLAYRYTIEGPVAKVHVYNPNVVGPTADDQWFSLRIDSTRALDYVTRSHGGKQVLCFFPLEYAAVEPPIGL